MTYEAITARPEMVAKGNRRKRNIRDVPEVDSLQRINKNDESRMTDVNHLRNSGKSDILDRNVAFREDKYEIHWTTGRLRQQWKGSGELACAQCKL